MRDIEMRGCCCMSVRASASRMRLCASRVGVSLFLSSFLSFRACEKAKIRVCEKERERGREGERCMWWVGAAHE